MAGKRVELIAGAEAYPSVPRTRHDGSGVPTRFAAVVRVRSPSRALGAALRADLGTLAPPGSLKHTPRDPLATGVQAFPWL